MSDKSELCNGCGRFAAADGNGRRGRMIDTGDGAGRLWTCTDCVPATSTLPNNGTDDKEDRT